MFEEVIVKSIALLDRSRVDESTPNLSNEAIDFTITSTNKKVAFWGTVYRGVYRGVPTEVLTGVHRGVLGAVPVGVHRVVYRGVKVRELRRMHGGCNGAFS